MAAPDAGEGDRLSSWVTSYAYAPGVDAPRPLGGTVHDTLGRVIEHGTGSRPGADTDGDTRDEPHVAG